LVFTFTSVSNLKIELQSNFWRGPHWSQISMMSQSCHQLPRFFALILFKLILVNANMIDPRRGDNWVN